MTFPTARHTFALIAALGLAAPAARAAVLEPVQPVAARAWARLDNGLAFQRPRGLGILPDGDLAVADETAQRIVVMSPDGHYRRTVAEGVGTGPGQFQNPAGVVANAAGELWVVDRDNSRLQRFALDGTFLQAVGAAGGGPGQFLQPSSMAISPDGDLYVCDQGNHRIVRLSSTGAFVSQWGSFGTGTSQFQFPSGIAVDRYGDVYVTDLYNDRVQKFTRTGTWIRSWGSTGAGNGQFQFPAGIAVDELGSVFVGETGGHRIQRFTDRGVWVATIVGANYGPSGTSNVPTGMVTNRQGQLFVAEYQSVLVQRFDYLPAPSPPAALGVQLASFNLGAVDPLSFPQELAADDQGGVYVQSHRLLVYRVNKQGQLLQSWSASPDNAYDSFQPLSGIAFHAGRVYVTDPIHGKVRIYERDGTPAGSWGSFPLTVPGGDWYLSDIRIDAQGVVNVQGKYGIERFDLAGNLLGSFTLPAGTYDGRLEAAPAGDLWTMTGTQLHHRAPTGSILHSFPSLAASPGDAVVVHDDPARGLYVANYASNQIRLMDETGAVLATQVLPAGSSVLSIDGDAAGAYWVGGAPQMVTRFGAPPVLRSISDHTPDEGGQVWLRFRASSAEGVNTASPVTQYEIHRKLDGVIPPDAVPAPDNPGWELVQTVPADGSAEYSVQVATRLDAIPPARWLTTYMVRARRQNLTFLDSDARAGYSTDQVPPDAPTAVTAVEDAGSTTLNWQPGAVAGTRYRIHRGGAFGFEAHEANVIAEPTGTSFVDAGVTGAVYAIEAMDDGENLSGSVQFNAQGVLGAPPREGNASFALRRLAPNPSDGGRVAVEFSLADAAPATLEMFDASGRRVHEQVVSGLPPGAHSLVVQPSRRLATGVYMVRLRTAQHSRQLRMLVVR